MLAAVGDGPPKRGAPELDKPVLPKPEGAGEPIPFVGPAASAPVIVAGDTENPSASQACIAPSYSDIKIYILVAFWGRTTQGGFQPSHVVVAVSHTLETLSACCYVGIRAKTFIVDTGIGGIFNSLASVGA